MRPPVPPTAPAPTLLERFLQATADQDLSTAASLCSPALRAVVPAISPSEFVTRDELIGWVRGLCDRVGTIRMEPWGLLRPTATSAGAVVMFTCFNAPGGEAAAGKDHRRPYWSSWKTIAAANTDERGDRITQLFFVMDDPAQPARDAMAGVVTGWYDAYVSQDLDGFMAPLASGLEAINYNHYQSTHPVSRQDYHEGFLCWCQRNYPGGCIVNDVVVRGSWVGVVVQFLTESKPRGQQKMTNEIHFMQLDGDRRILRQYFYETDRCGYPDRPCRW